jgi:uncharacterized protein YceK
MARAAIRLVAVLFVVWLSGCGTITNTCWRSPDEKCAKMYGGVKMDIEAGREASSQVSHPDDLQSFVEGVRIVTCCTLDLPFSAVGDTLTLPITFVSELGQAMIEGDMDPNKPRPPEPGPVVAAFPYRVTSTSPRER